MLPNHVDTPSSTTPGSGNNVDTNADKPSLTAVPEAGLQETATVRGSVQYRIGDGPTLTVPQGPVQVDHGASDVTISWQVGLDRQATAVPTIDFARFIKEGAIVLDTDAEKAEQAAALPD